MSLHSKAQRLSYKTLFLVIIFLLIPIVLLLRIGQRAHPASAGWFDDGWGYRKAVDITNSVGTTLTDFQVSISIGTSALINVGKMKSDCSDLRITNQTGQVLPHWIEGGNPGCNAVTDTKVWIKVPNIPASGGTVYVYYGNPSATNIENPLNIFLLFDNFSKIDTDKWRDTTGTNTLISDGYDSKALTTSADTNDIRYFSRSTFSGGYAIKARMKEDSTDGGLFFDTQDDANGYLITSRRSGGTTAFEWYKRTTGSWTSLSGHTSVSSWTNTEYRTLEVLRIGTSIIVKDNESALSYTTSTDSTYSSGSVGIRGSSQQTIDWFFVRKIATADPASSLSATEEQSKAPVASWSFDEGVGTTTYDSSSNRKNGRVSGATWATEDQCISGKCLQFDGSDDYISIADNNLWDFANKNMTLSLWLKTNGTGDDFYTIMDHYTGGAESNGWTIYVNPTTKYLNFSHVGTNSCSLNSTMTFTDSKWRHITVTMDGSNCVLYVDGKLDRTDTYSDLVDRDSTLYIGGRGTGYNINAAIDEVKIYPYARSTAEIKSDYNAGKAHANSSEGSSVNLGSNKNNSEAFSDGLVSYWKMDETTGTMSDSSGNGNTAPVTGSANFVPGKFGNAFRPGIGTTNLVTNPSFETNLTSWSTRFGFPNNGTATSTQSNEKAKYGSYSIKQIATRTADTDGATNGYGEIYLSVGVSHTTGDNVTMSLWYYVDSLTDADNDSTVGFYLRANQDGAYVSDYASTTWNNATIRQNIGNWVNVIVSGTAPANSNQSNILIRHYLRDIPDSVTTYTDGAQIEKTSTANPYVDGSIDIGSSWTGTAHGSTSVRFTSSAAAANSTSLNITGNQISMGEWVYLINNPTTNGIIFQKSGYIAGYRHYVGSTGLLSIGIGRSAGAATIRSNSSIPLNQWVHLFSTYDGQNVKIYINGNLDRTVGSTDPLISDTGNITFGATEYPPITGYIDEVRIYNRTLSANEVKQLYEYAPSQLAYWKLDEGIGTGINDSSGNSKNGTFGTGNSAPAWSTGKYGKGLTFDGSNDVVSVGSTVSNVSSVSFWVKPSTTSQTFLGLDGGTHYISASSGVVSATGFVSPVIYINGIGTSSGLTANTWSYITVSTSTGFDATNLTLGKSSTNFLNGSLDEIRLYNYALNSKQIVSDFNASHPAVGSPIASALAHYKFDEGFGTVANNNGSVGSTLNGTISGATWTNDGKYGKALSFNGTSNKVTLNTPINSSTITISAWVNPQTPTEYYPCIFSNLEYNNDNGYLLTFNTTSLSRLSFYVGNESIGTTDTGITTNNWYHIVATWDGSMAKIYINNRIVASGVLGTPAGYNGASNMIGDYAAYNFNGLIDDIKIYNYALTENEVKTDYNQGKTIVMGSLGGPPVGGGNTAPSTASSQEYCVPGDTATCPPPVARWDFNEGVGVSAFDTSGNSLHGALAAGNSAPTWSTAKVGKGLRFNGSNTFVRAIGNTLFNFDYNQNFTISTWVKIPTSQGGIASTARRIIDYPGSTAYPFTIWFRSETGSPANKITVARYDGTNNPAINSTNTYNDNQWHYLTFLKIGSTLSLYMDGKLDSSTTDTTTASTLADNNLYFGSTTGTANFFNGLLDQIKIYNYARTPAQIALDYNQGAPIAQWKFDECQGDIAHDSVGTNNGAINIGASGTQTSAGTCQTASTAWGVGATGKINSSLNFDGTDDKIVINHSDLIQPSTFTYSAWIKPNGTAWEGDIITKFFDRRIHQINGTIRFRPGGNGDVTTPNGSIVSGQWQHVAVAYNGTTANIYINGINKASGDRTVGTNSYNLQIGGYDWSGPYMFNGQIDDVQIYNYSLTPAQIKTLYNGGAVNFK